MKMTINPRHQGQDRSADACEGCGIVLTAEEAHDYHYRCLPCEREHRERVTSWMNGRPDRYMDVYYNNNRSRFMQ